MRPTLLLLASTTALAGAPAPCLWDPAPCLWDYDTLQQERARFPTALELITGRFPRHSPAYYEWRIADREERRAAGDDSPALFDDLAVAHSKLGRHDAAIALMAEKEALHPGLYETAANLGTFHIHAGRYAEGAQHIARAIEINPDAHFGREVYQELLVRYVEERSGDAQRLPLPMRPARGRLDGGFWGFLARERGIERQGIPGEILRASKGVLGMMRFGHHDSPVLLEALADVLTANGQFEETDARRLAARALLKASYEVEGEEATGRYRALAAEVLRMQTPDPTTMRSMELEELEPRFQEELAEARTWYDELVAREAAWIAAGEDVDARFAETYYDGAPGVPVEKGGALGGRRLPWLVALVAVAALALAWLRRRPRTGAAAG